jgi:hypothetical protein
VNGRIARPFTLVHDAARWLKVAAAATMPDQPSIQQY